MKQYLDLCRHVLEHGTYKDDRTGTGTYSVFGYQARYNLEEGFPLVTTKKVFLRGIIHELLWFINGDTNIKYLVDNNVHIWDDWAYKAYSMSEDFKGENMQEFVDKIKALDKDDPFVKKYGDLHKIYGYQWNNFESGLQIVKVSPKILKKNFTIFPMFEIIKCDSEIILNTKGLEFKIINEYHKGSGKNKRLLCDVQFLHTGSIRVGIRKDAALKGAVDDYFEPSVYKVGYKGKKEEIDLFLQKYGKKTYEIIRRKWAKMIERCYCEKCKEYKYYGEKGIFVDARWHSLSNFLNDVQFLPQFRKFLSFPEEYQLDKDYYASNAYSKETCVWLKRQHNILYITSKPFFAIDKNNNRKLYISESLAKEELGSYKVSQVLLGRRKTSNGFRFEYLNDEKNIYRYQLDVNQLANLIEQIKTNPNSRRLIISAWNPCDVDKMALPPCHSFMQFYVINGKLSCQLYQRSADIFLGVPFNIASYALFTMMIAQVCGLGVGEFVHTMGDAHIYSNHVDQIKLQLSREPKKLPTMKINPNVKSIYDFKIEDFTLENYECWPRIKGEVAV